MPNEVTGNYIKNAVVKAIIAKYPTMTVYDEKQEQGFDPPCFIVRVLNSDQKDGVNRIRSITNDILVQWIPPHMSYTKNAECADIGYELCSVLRNMESPDGLSMRSYNMRYEIVDQTLSWTATYQIRAIAPDPTPMAGHLEINGGIK
jgi:hypothetical protein